MLQSFAILLAARICLFMIPAKRLTSPPIVRGVPDMELSRLIAAFARASRLAPGATCLVRAIAAQSYLARYGYSSQIRIGAANTPAGFQAHAWLECEGSVLIGGTTTPYTPFTILGAP